MTGISYVLVAQVSGEESDRARSLRTAAVTSLDQRAGFVQAGSTDRGVLYRLEADASPRAPLSSAEQATARLVITIQLVLVLAALLLSVPTRASRRAARARSRIVGRAPEEPLVLPRHPEDREDSDDREDPGTSREHGGASAVAGTTDDGSSETPEPDASAETGSPSSPHQDAETDPGDVVDDADHDAGTKGNVGPDSEQDERERR